MTDCKSRTYVKIIILGDSLEIVEQLLVRGSIPCFTVAVVSKKPATIAPTGWNRAQLREQAGCRVAKWFVRYYPWTCWATPTRRPSVKIFWLLLQQLPK